MARGRAQGRAPSPEPEPEPEGEPEREDPPPAGQPLCRVVDPNNPQCPEDDTKQLYQWTYNSRYSEYSFAEFRKDKFSYVCEDAQGRHWFRKPCPNAGQPRPDNPLAPEFDHDHKYRWAAFGNDVDAAKLVEDGWDYTSTRFNMPHTGATNPVNVWRKKRARESDA